MLQQVYRSDRLSRKLLVLSFEFSQWELWLQRCIFRYLHVRYPAWHPSEEETKALVQGTYLSVCKLLEKSDRNQNLPSDEVWEIENGIAKYYNHLPHILFEVYNDLEDQHPSPPEVVQHLAHGILEMDAGYLFTGRPSQDPQPVPLGHYDSRPRKGVYLSHLCHYGFHSYTTGTPEYNQMFAEVAAYFRSTPEAALGLFSDSQESVNETLRKVVTSYNSSHPFKEPIIFPFF